MGQIKGLDHVAFAVPDLAKQVTRFVGMGMIVVTQMDNYALVADPVSGFKIEMNLELGSPARFRHLGYVTDDVDAAHSELVSDGMTSTEGPHRREFAKMRTAFLNEEGGIEVQLVKYD